MDALYSLDGLPLTLIRIEGTAIWAKRQTDPFGMATFPVLPSELREIA
jgi:hypothetical protein